MHPASGTIPARPRVAGILQKLGTRTAVPFAVCFSNGAEYRNSDRSPAFTVRFLSRGAEARAAAFGHVGILEAYFDGTLEFEGSLPAAFAVAMEGGFDSASPLVAVRNRWHDLRHSNADWAGAKQNARAHYGLGTGFFRLWLDEPLMMYTCAYWPPGVATLEQAQAAKIDHVCRKLRIGPRDHVVDIGCGFGGFMFRAHEQTGARITGVNTTTEQVDMVREEIARRGLQRELSVIERDFREVRREYDKVVSIGVLEHAGRGQLAGVVAAHARSLKRGGLGILHFIGHVAPHDTEFFIRRYIFPGGWIPSLPDVLVELERCGLEVLDVENLRRHYALTLDAWAERFERNWERIRALDPKRFDERFRRIWCTYLHGCAQMFRAPDDATHLFQVVFSKGNVNPASYPMSRAFVYPGEPSHG
jgi:cyclopropane-fatty-acyl-phospholipid synthase